MVQLRCFESSPLTVMRHSGELFQNGRTGSHSSSRETGQSLAADNPKQVIFDADNPKQVIFDADNLNDLCKNTCFTNMKIPGPRGEPGMILSTFHIKFDDKQQ